MSSILVKVNIPPRLEYTVVSEMPLSKWAKTAAGKKFITILDDTNPKSSDAVTKGCIVNYKKCKLNKKFDTCTK